MKRGGILLLIIVLLIVILSVAAYFVLSGNLNIGGAPAEEAPPAELSTIVVMAQPVARDELIVDAALEEIPYPAEKITASMFRAKSEVADVYYAKYPLVQGQPLTRELISERPGVLQEGSDVAKTIPPGMTAISIPISRLGAVGYAIRDGDRVNLIVTTSFVDLDTSFQSMLPNNTAVVTGTGFQPETLPVLTMSIAGGEAQGRAELEPTLNQAVYLIPSEQQRPRLVSQMILQDIQVLHIGAFNINGDQTAVSQPAEGTEPVEGEEQAPPPPPDLITLIVTPQDAISLTYLLSSQANLTLTLRSPDDPNLFDTESVTLQYLISQYKIDLPAKLPYGLNPRIDSVTDPTVVGQ
ncbi:MAG: RcpC/CpaB family pilus assembly protein [Anaerolineales bacterium]|jgi:pilus assembly protein CpaB|nr:RcpC/CpaB family pilus assembly protein [Anaerolineales bacterium]